MNKELKLIENINNTTKILKSIPNVDYDIYREQLWTNTNTIKYTKYKNDSNNTINYIEAKNEPNDNSITELKSLNQKLEEWFLDNTWRFTVNEFNLLNFDKVYKSQLKFLIEWHAGFPIPHPLIYYIQFYKNGFFNITSSHPKFEFESIKRLKSQNINFGNIFKIPAKGKIELKSDFFNLDGRIIGEMIIDKNINFTDYNDGDKIVDSKMLILMNNENAT